MFCQLHLVLISRSLKTSQTHDATNNHSHVGKTRKHNFCRRLPVRGTLERNLKVAVSRRAEELLRCPFESYCGKRLVSYPEISSLPLLDVVHDLEFDAHFFLFIALRFTLSRTNVPPYRRFIISL